MYRQFEAVNPFRSPSWRYDRVLRLVSHRPKPLKASRFHDDKWVKAYRNFVMDMQACETRDEEIQLFHKRPDIYLAHLIRNQPDREWQAMLQAMVLAELSDEEIAAWAKTTPGAIHWYCQLFFDIRDRLDATGYISKVIVGRFEDARSAQDGTMTEFQRDLCYKMFGYYGGPLVLEAVITCLNRGNNRPVRTSDVAEFMNDAISQIIRNRTALTVRTMTVNKFTYPTLLATYGQILSITKEAQLQGGAPSDVKRNVEEMLNQLRWSVGRKGHDRKTSLEQKWDATAVEPRADEMMLLAQGRVPETLQGLENAQLRLPVEEDHGKNVQ